MVTVFVAVDMLIPSPMTPIGATAIVPDMVENTYHPPQRASPPNENKSSLELLDIVNDTDVLAVTVATDDLILFAKDDLSAKLISQNCNFANNKFKHRKDKIMSNMKNNYWQNWFKAAGIRAIKTIAQSAVGMIAVGAGMHEIDWLYVGSVALAAGILSMLTSIAGLPEVTKDDETNS